jgi:hypothetical protein
VLGGGVTLSVAALVVVLFEMPIERLRTVIRARGLPVAHSVPEIITRTTLMETPQLAVRDAEVTAQPP